MTTLTQAFRGNHLVARVLRSSSWLLLGYGGSQALRLASNLILARLLFPEAFGLMALVSMITAGLMLFSDVGIGPAIAQSKRGDDPAFLNTAWTIQVIRGFCLWGAACLLAWPASQLYDAPELASYLPIAAVSLILAGFNPTRIETANRHLLVGRLTVLELMDQFIGILCMIVLAWLTQSVIALVIGGVIGAAAKLLLTHVFLPGEANRFQWERASVRELIRFGKWIFLSTAFWFISSQGDKAILGRFLSLETLGIYNIGYYLASFPLLLGYTVAHKVMIPVYRELLPLEGAATSRKLRKLRVAVTVGMMGLLAVMACAGPWLVDVLYDDRYAQAGAMVVMIACALIPQVIGVTYDRAALAAGDSRRFFVFSGLRAVIQVAALLIGVTQFGLLGLLVAMGVATILIYPVVIWLARVHGVWDAAHDAVAAVAAAAIIAMAVSLHITPILELSGL